MKNPYFNLIGKAWQNAAGRRGWFVLAYAMLVVGNAIDMVEPYVIGKAFNAIQEGGPQAFRNFLFWLVISAVVPMLFWLFHGPARIIERINAFFIERNFRERIFTAATEMPVKWHKDHHTGDTHDRIEKSARALNEFALSGFQFIETLIIASGSMLMIAVLLPGWGYTIFLLMAVIVTVIWGMDRIIIRIRKEINARQHKVAEAFFDYISNIRTVITLRLQKLITTSYVRRIMASLPAVRRSGYVIELKWFILGVIVAANSALLLGLYVWRGFSLEGTFLIGGLTAFYVYITRFAHAFFSFAWQWSDLVNYSTDVEASAPIFAAHAELKVSEKTLAQKEWRNIELSGVHFSYKNPGEKRSHLSGVSIVLKPGKKIALVGESGSGKSTLLSLIRGLEKPEKAELVVDGNRMSDLSFLAAITTLIPQDPEIFDSTIEFNITAGIEHEPEEIDEAVRLARFEPVLKRLPQGLKTNIKERGVNLSGGERQRLALARGIFAADESSLLLLDEPTSSVDSRNETAVYKNLFQRFPGKCIVSSVHRLHLLPMFDEIYVMADGKLLERGTYAELKDKPDGALAAMLSGYFRHAGERPDAAA